ncbi:MAG: VWA domain-containing protein, partial [Chloroflexi bacterium]|nr:VWA domain-containing protein [Chloroflexota bacterium]
MALYRYSEWDGTQEIPPLEPDDLLESLTDDLMNFGDLQHAMRNLLQRGMRNPLGQRMEGVRDLLQQLRQQRRQKLDQFNLGSAFEDIENKLAEVLDMERSTLDRRLAEANQQQGQPGEGEQASGADTP